MTAICLGLNVKKAELCHLLLAGSNFRINSRLCVRRSDAYNDL